MSLGSPLAPPWYDPAATSTVIPYATDEAIAIRAAGDFATLVPPDQSLATRKDGAIAAGTWTLTSPTVDLSTRGIAPGNVVVLHGPSPTIRSGGDLYVVAAVVGAGLALRRRGLPAGSGEPPAAGAGATKVEFSIPTLVPQILDASYDLDRRYGVSDLVLGRRHVDLFDPREVRDACVLTVLKNQYFAQARQAKEDTFLAKAAEVGRQLDDLLRRVEVLWRPNFAEPDRSGPLSIRIARG